MDFSICADSNLAINFNLLHYFSNFRAVYYAMMAGTVSLPCGEPWHFFLLPWYSNTMMICTTTADPYNLTSTCWTSFEPQSKSQYWVMTSWIKYGIYCCGAILNAKMLIFFCVPIFQLLVACNTYLSIYLYLLMHFKSTITTVFCFVNFEIAVCVHFAMNIF